MKRTELRQLLHHLGACDEARLWVDRTPGTVRNVWNICEDPAFLFWFLGEIGIGCNSIALISCQCARLALQYVPDGEDRPRICIETTEAYLRGEATTEQVYEANRIACAAANAAITAHDYARTHAAHAAHTTARAAIATTYTAHTAAHAAARAAIDTANHTFAVAIHTASEYSHTIDYTAGKMVQVECCNVIRSHIPFSAVLRLGNEVLERFEQRRKELEDNVKV